MKNTVFTVITAVLLLATLCLMAVGARVRAKCVELEGNGAKPIQAANVESLNVQNDYDTIVSADTRDGVVYLSLISGSQPRPNACGLTPKNPSAEWTGWGGPLDTDNATVGEGPGTRNKIVTGGYYFKRGLGAHAVSTLVYDLSGDTYTRFEGWIGMSDEKDPGNRFCADGGRSNFNFLLDGHSVYRRIVQGVWHGETNPHPVKVAFDIPSTARELKIVMGDGGDGINCDHPVIGDAKLLTSRVTGEGRAPVTVASLNQPPVTQPAVQVQEPTWVLEDSWAGPVGDRFQTVEAIAFAGNNLVFWASGDRLYKWDFEANQAWWHDFNGRRVIDIDIPRNDPSVVAYALRDNDGGEDWVSLRSTADLSWVTGTRQEGVMSLSADEGGYYLAVRGAWNYYTYDIWGASGWQFDAIDWTGMSATGAIALDVSDDFGFGRLVRTFITRWAGSSITVSQYFNGEDRYLPNLSVTGNAFTTGPLAVRNGGVLAATPNGRIYYFVWKTPTDLDRATIESIGNRNSEGHRHGPIVSLASMQGVSRHYATSTAHDDFVCFWDLYTGALAQKLDVGFRSAKIAFSQNNSYMAVANGSISSGDRKIKIYRWTGNSPGHLAAPAKEAEPAPPTALLSNYPNPFNPETWIPYQLSDPAEVTVSIYSVDGKLVRTLELGQMPAGVYSDKGRAAYWNGQNEQGEPVASGVYFYTLKAGEFSATRKMVIRK